MVVTVFFGMWLMGLGYGLVTSVAVELIPKMGTFLGFFGALLHISSGVVLPVSTVPEPYRGWLLLNPLLHGTEAARVGISPYYHAIPGMDIGYTYKCAIVAIFFGLALHRRFETKLITL